MKFATFAPCAAILSSFSAWRLSRKSGKSGAPAASGECACCTPQQLQGSALKDDVSEAETHSVGSHDDDTMSSSCSEDHEPEGPSMLSQSPIDIQASRAAKVPMHQCIVVSSHANDAELVYNGKGFSVRWGPTSENALTIGEKVYHAVQFHFHTPSEHTLDGRPEAMELHLVHQADDGALAVVAVFFRPGAENAFLAQFWNVLDELEVGEPASVALSGVDPRALEIPAANFFRYSGSLTTPPYTEGVEWVVVQHIVEASEEQLAAFRRVLPGPNARDVQPLNKREVHLVV